MVSRITREILTQGTLFRDLMEQLERDRKLYETGGRVTWKKLEEMEQKKEFFRSIGLLDDH